MGKSFNGKELGKGISQRKDGLYQARFINRFGKRETIYAKTLNEIRHQLRTEQYEDEKELNVIRKEMTLDEWYEIWMNTCKRNCRNSTKETYASHYRRVQKELGFGNRTSYRRADGFKVVRYRHEKEYPEFEKFSPHCFRHTFATRAIETAKSP